MNKYAVVLALPDYIQSDEPEPGCYVANVQDDTLTSAITLAQQDAAEVYREGGYECEPDDFAHLVTFEGHPPTLQFGNSA